MRKKYIYNNHSLSSLICIFVKEIVRVFFFKCRIQVIMQTPNYVRKDLSKKNIRLLSSYISNMLSVHIH